MMKPQEIELLVNVKLDVPADTVKGCLNLIEMWLNADETRRISGGVRHSDGKIEPFKMHCGRSEDKE